MNRCASRIPWSMLVDYWADDLAPDRAAALEEHLFGCAECAPEAGRVGAVTETLRSALPPVVSREKLDALRVSGLRVREGAFSPGARSEVHFPGDIDVLIHHLGGLELSRAERVSFRIRIESTGEVLAEVGSVPFQPDEGAVLVACQHHYASLPGDTVFDISVHDADRSVRTASYTILHRFE